jgi:hypothetical protein
VLDGRRRERGGDCVHAAAREVDARDRVHVGDDRVQGQGAVRRHPGVERLKREHPLGARVGQELRHLSR